MRDSGEKIDIYVKIPSMWRSMVGGRDLINSKGRTVREVLQSLTETYPELKNTILDQKGEVRPLIIHVNNKDTRFIQQLDTPLDTGDQISVILSIFPVFAGG